MPPAPAVSCQQAYRVDLRAFVRDARGARWADFRDHYPLCAECAAEVRAWTELERALQAGGSDAGSHPGEEELLDLCDRPEGLSPELRRILDNHVVICPSCADELAVFRTFDFTGLMPLPAAQPAFAVPAAAAGANGARSVEASASAVPPSESPLEAAAGSVVAPVVAADAPVVALGAAPVAEPPPVTNATPAAGEASPGVDVALSDAPSFGAGEDPLEEIVAGAPVIVLSEPAVSEPPAVDPVESPPVETPDGSATTEAASEVTPGCSDPSPCDAGLEAPAEVTAACEDAHAETVIADVAMPLPFEPWSPVARRPRLGVALARLVLHPAFAMAAVAAIVAPMVWRGDLPQFPFGQATRVVQVPERSDLSRDDEGEAGRAAALPAAERREVAVPVTSQDELAAAATGASAAATSPSESTTVAAVAPPVEEAATQSAAPAGDGAHAAPVPGARGLETTVALPPRARAAAPVVHGREDAPETSAVGLAEAAAPEAGRPVTPAVRARADRRRPLSAADDGVPSGDDVDAVASWEAPPSVAREAPERPWTTTMLDAARPAEITASELGAGLVLEVPVPDDVRDGAVLQVRVQGEQNREIVERLALGGSARQVAVRVPVAWLHAGTYRVELGVIESAPAPVPVGTFALSVR